MNKKLLLLLLTLLAALPSAWAWSDGYYLNGNFNGGNYTSSEDSKHKFKHDSYTNNNSRELFVLTLDKLENDSYIFVRKVDGNTHRISNIYNNNDDDKSDNATYNIKLDEEYGQSFNEHWSDRFHYVGPDITDVRIYLEIPNDNKYWYTQFKITGTEASTTPTSLYMYTEKGSDGWIENGTPMSQTTSTSGIFTSTYDVPANTTVNFTFSTASSKVWDNKDKLYGPQNKNSNALSFNNNSCTYSVYTGSNYDGVWTAKETADYTYSISLNTNTLQVTFTRTLKAPTPITSLYLYTSKNWTSAVSRKPNESGSTFTFDVDVKKDETIYFAFTTLSTQGPWVVSNTSNRYAAGNNGNVSIALGETKTMVNAASSPYMFKGTVKDRKYRITVYGANATSPTVTIAATDEDIDHTATVPAMLYMSTLMADNDVNAWIHGVKMVKNGNKFTGVVLADNERGVGNRITFFNTKVTRFPSKNTNRYSTGSNTNKALTATEVTNNTTTSNMSLDAGTGYWTLPDKGVYTVTVDFTNAEKPTVKFYKEDPTKYIYFNAGNEYFISSKWKNNDGSQKALKLYVYKNGDDEWNGSLCENPERIDPDMALFRLKKPSGVSGIWRIYAQSDGDGENMSYDLRENNSAWDRNNWDKFIYASGDGTVNQSYLTFEEFLRLRDKKDQNGIYFAGANKGWNLNPPTNFEKSEGVYIQEITLTSSNKDFKMSFLSPGAIYNSLPSSDRNGNFDTNFRGWATFNLGIIGCSNYEYKPSKTQVPFVDSYGEGQHMFVDFSNPYIINFSNQFNWTPNFTTSSKTAWIVVDMDYQTACILPYDPQPTLESLSADRIDTDNNVQIIDLRNEEKTGIVSNVEDFVINGSDDINEAHFRFANLVEATGNLYPPRNSSKTAANTDYTALITGSNPKFNVDYTMTFDGESLGSINDIDGSKKEAVLQSTVIVDGTDKDMLSARGVYTSNERFTETGDAALVFRTNTETSGINTSKLDKLLPPTITKVTTKVFENIGKYKDNPDDENEAWKTWPYYDVFVGIEFELPYPFIQHNNETFANSDFSYSIYPTFEVYVNNTPATLVREDDWFFQRNSTYLSDCDPDGPGYIIPSTDLAIGEGSWAVAAIQAVGGEDNHHTKGFLPLVARDAIEKATYSSSKSYPVKIELSATYPFHVYNDGENIKVKGINAVSRRRANTPYEPVDMTRDAKIVTKDKTETYINGTMSIGLSGVEDVMMTAPAEGPVELYNLQGVKVMDAAPAPGIYIRRNADGSASKIVIR